MTDGGPLVRWMTPDELCVRWPPRDPRGGPLRWLSSMGDGSEEPSAEPVRWFDAEGVVVAGNLVPLQTEPEPEPEPDLVDFLLDAWLVLLARCGVGAGVVDRACYGGLR